MPPARIRGAVAVLPPRAHGRGDAASYSYIEDGIVLVGADGRIAAVGPAAELARAGRAATPIAHHPDALILPGFIDTHIHFPQTQVIASYGAQLLEWLEKYTFVEEQKYGDLDHAARQAEFFLDELARNGTTTACCLWLGASVVGRGAVRGGGGARRRHDRRHRDHGPQRPAGAARRRRAMPLRRAAA